MVNRRHVCSLQTYMKAKFTTHKINKNDKIMNISKNLMLILGNIGKRNYNKVLLKLIKLLNIQIKFVINMLFNLQ